MVRCAANSKSVNRSRSVNPLVIRIESTFIILYYSREVGNCIIIGICIFLRQHNYCGVEFCK